MNHTAKSIQIGLVVLLTGFVVGCSPMRVSMKSGSLDFLKGQHQVNVTYSYEGMGVGEYANEQDYINRKVAEYNAKEPGKGETWRQAWLGNRTRRYQPHFEELLNAHVPDKLNLQFGAYQDAPYTLHLRTTFTEPGWNVAIMRHPAFIDAEARFYETTNPANTVAEVSILKSPGADAWGFDFDPGQRIRASRDCLLTWR